jgi:hypothetical protein
VAYARLSQSSVASVVDGIITDDLTFDVTGAVHYLG